MRESEHSRKTFPRWSSINNSLCSTCTNNSDWSMPYTMLDAHAEPAFAVAHSNCWVPSHEKLHGFVDFLRWHRPSIFDFLVFERRRANNTEQSDLIKTSESASSLRASQHSVINHRLQSKSCAFWCSFLHNIYCKHVNAWTAMNKPICHSRLSYSMSQQILCARKTCLGMTSLILTRSSFLRSSSDSKRRWTRLLEWQCWARRRISVAGRKEKASWGCGILMVMRFITIECEKWLSQTLRNESPDCEHFHERDNKSISTAPLSTKPGNWIAEDEKLLLTSYEKAGMKRKTGGIFLQ